MASRAMRLRAITYASAAPTAALMISAITLIISVHWAWNHRRSRASQPAPATAAGDGSIHSRGAATHMATCHAAIASRGRMSTGSSRRSRRCGMVSPPGVVAETGCR